MMIIISVYQSVIFFDTLLIPKIRNSTVMTRCGGPMGPPAVSKYFVLFMLTLAVNKWQYSKNVHSQTIHSRLDHLFVGTA
jgi:hypothetical protein